MNIFLVFMKKKCVKDDSFLALWWVLFILYSLDNIIDLCFDLNSPKAKLAPKERSRFTMKMRQRWSFTQESSLEPMYVLCCVVVSVLLGFKKKEYFNLFWHLVENVRET